MPFGGRVVAGSSNDGQTVVQSDTLHGEEGVTNRAMRTLIGTATKMQHGS